MISAAKRYRLTPSSGHEPTDAPGPRTVRRKSLHVDFQMGDRTAVDGSRDHSISSCRARYRRLVIRLERLVSSSPHASGRVSFATPFIEAVHSSSPIGYVGSPIFELDNRGFPRGSQGAPHRCFSLSDGERLAERRNINNQ